MSKHNTNSYLIKSIFSYLLLWLVFIWHKIAIINICEIELPNVRNVKWLEILIFNKIFYLFCGRFCSLSTSFNEYEIFLSVSLLLRPLDSLTPIKSN